jgi:hypothetical protein
MRWGIGKSFFQIFLPEIKILEGKTVNKVNIPIVPSTLAHSTESFVKSIRGTMAAKKEEITGIKRLHTDTEARNANLFPFLKSLLRDFLRIGLKRYFKRGWKNKESP